jgi:hypothetical protein
MMMWRAIDRNSWKPALSAPLESADHMLAPLVRRNVEGIGGKEAISLS